jgi:hypothetical protein
VVWKITSDPVMPVQICERLPRDSECWFRRYVVELLEEIASPVALPALLARLTDDRPALQAARQAIEKINRNKNCVVPT